MSWTAPIQLAICLGLLIDTLGVSALAGFAIFFIATPIQVVSMKQMFKMRQTSMQWTDKRAKLLQELLGGMKILKFFAWEIPFLKRIFGYRRNEMKWGAVISSVPAQVDQPYIAGIFEDFSSFGQGSSPWRCLCLHWHPS
jgi:hypothetical protein